MCLGGVFIVGRWFYTPFTDAKETLDPVPICLVSLHCNILYRYPSSGVFLFSPVTVPHHPYPRPPPPPPSPWTLSGIYLIATTTSSQPAPTVFSLSPHTGP